MQSFLLRFDVSKGSAMKTTIIKSHITVHTVFSLVVHNESPLPWTAGGTVGDIDGTIGGPCASDGDIITSVSPSLEDIAVEFSSVRTVL